ncbi:MAG: hypothetical protein ACC628_27100 [Pirellulaceae bacterium]
MSTSGVQIAAMRTGDSYSLSTIFCSSVFDHGSLPAQSGTTVLQPAAIMIVVTTPTKANGHK